MIISILSLKSKNVKYNNIDFKLKSSNEINYSERVIKSIKSLSKDNCNIDFNKLEKFIDEKINLNYKNWEDTDAYAKTLNSIIGNPNNSDDFKTIFDRVLSDGNWYNAKKYKTNEKPWVVLVTGLNGIRKSTSIYQPWYDAVLQEALGNTKLLLPNGQNSFFRQLDYMIATIGNYDLRDLYSSKDITTSIYSSRKDEIFKRYRTIAEILGVLLLRSAQENRMNIMLETSGRDQAMFQYVDYLFDNTNYNKLVLRFTIDNIKYAEKSVDKRMLDEIQRGFSAASQGVDAKEIVKINAGGPYGSEVLKGVQADSDRVWDIVKKENRKDWYYACIEVRGDEDQSKWFANAILPNGKSSKTLYQFQRN